VRSTGLNEENVQVVCNTLDSALLNAVTLWIKNRIPLIERFYNIPVDSNPNYKNMKFSVIDDITKGKCVFIKGHSFGGAIVNRLAISLQNYANSNPNSDFTRNLSKLFILALASIYIAPYHLISKISIYNAINTGDLAFNVNGYSTPIKEIKDLSTQTGTYYYQSKKNPSLIWIHDTKKYEKYEYDLYLERITSHLYAQSLQSMLIGNKIEINNHNDYYVEENYLKQIRKQYQFYLHQIKKQSQFTLDSINVESLKPDSINVESLKQALFPGLRQLV
jgi:hypothetical protein